MVYLDHNATTPIDERVVEAMLPWLRAGFGNPSSIHSKGRQARAALDQARDQVAQMVAAHPSQVIFTSGGTEANNMALKGTAFRSPPGRVAVSAIEHASVRATACSLKRFGWELDTAAVTADGICDVEHLAAVLTPETRMASVMWANNETGTIQPVRELAELCRERGVLFHTDAVQAAGKLEVDFPASGARLLSLSAHKLYGPKGVGALVVDKTVELEPLFHGGGQERDRRGGTENLAAIVGFGVAAELARIELDGRRRQLEELRQYLERRLHQVLPEAVIIAEKAERLANTVFLTIPGIEGQTLIMALDRNAIEVSSGSACGSEHKEPSTVLKAMGVERELALGAIRISTGVDSTTKDMDLLISALESEVRQLRKMASNTGW